MSEPFHDPRWYRVAQLRPRLRGHVRVHRHRYRRASWYVLQDEASGRQFRFTPQAYLLVGLLDGRTSVQEAWETVFAQIGDEAPGQGEVVRLLAEMHGADLLQADAAPDTADLHRRNASHIRRTWFGRLGNPMSLRFPLFDPDRALGAIVDLMPRGVGRLLALVWAALVVPAPLLVAQRWPELVNDVAERALDARTLIGVACIYPFVKLCHELGHALTVKAGGGEVHDVGVMMVALLPVPYVDASASTAFRSKWRRAQVAAAGILVELAIAGLALDVWLLAEPGAVRSIAFNAMLVAGVSTLLLNGNPLLRFDGYFVLSDVIEIPNLAARAARYWSSTIDHRIFGAPKVPAPIASGERAWFIAYAPAALIYRISVTLAVATMLANRFFAAGVALALWGVAVNLVWPILRGSGRLIADPRLKSRRGRTAAVFGLGSATVAALVLLVPLPLHTVAEGTVWMPDASIVRAARDGVVERVAALPGTSVRKGLTLFVSGDPAAQSDAQVAAAELAGLRAELDDEAFDDQVQAAVTRQKIAALAAGLARKQRALDELLLAAPTDGAFVVPQAADVVGRFVHRGDVLGYVVPRGERTLRIVVPQADVDLVRNRTLAAEAVIVGLPGRTWAVRILREVPAGSNELPSRALTHDGGGQFAADPRDKDGAKTMQRTFQFDVALPSEARIDVFGGHALVRFNHGAETIAAQAYRRLRQMLLSHFDA